jgi:hypothetical protein
LRFHVAFDFGGRGFGQDDGHFQYSGSGFVTVNLVIITVKQREAKGLVGGGK